MCSSDLLESGDDGEAARLLEEAKTAARAIGKDLKPMDPKRPDRGGIELIATRKFPLLESIAAWEILLMALWAVWALWPVWNRLVNGVLLGGDRDRIRRARRVKLVGCLALAGLVQQGAGGASRAMGAGRVEGAQLQGLQQRLPGLRSEGRGGVVVEVDGAHRASARTRR